MVNICLSLVYTIMKQTVYVDHCACSDYINRANSYASAIAKPDKQSKFICISNTKTEQIQKRKKLSHLNY